jgi:chaperonin GroEL
LIDGDIMTADYMRFHAAAAAKRGLPLVVIANMAGGETVEMLGRLKIDGQLQVAVVQSPLFGNNRTILMKDLAKMTGAKIIGNNYGNMAHLGCSGNTQEARLEAASKMHGTLNGFKSNMDSTLLVYDIDEKYIDSIKDNDDDFSKERIAMLNSGMATIYVGGNSDVEIQEITHRVEDAVNATRAALSKGVVAGGGLALLKASEVLKDVELENDDEQLGVDTLYKILSAPSEKILANANSNYIVSSDNYPVGFDVMKGKETNMIESGIIDPVMVVSEALRNSVSVSSSMLSAGAIILG